MIWKFVASALILFSAIQVSAAEASIAPVKPACSKLVSQHRIGTTNFLIQIYCEGALGTYVGIIYDRPMIKPRDGAWKISSRYWDGVWANDVVNFLVIDDERILIATSGAYGEAGIYQLGLTNKAFEKIAGPKTKESSIEGYAIVGFNPLSHVLTYTVDGESSTKPHTLKVK